MLLTPLAPSRRVRGKFEKACYLVVCGPGKILNLGSQMAEHAIDLNHPQAQLSDLVRKAARGEDVILTEGGEPVAKIIPISRARGPREFGSAKGLIHMADDFDEPLEDFGDYV